MQDAVRGFKLSRLTGPRVRAPVRPYVTEGASSLRKWRHFPRIDYDVLFGKSLRWGMPRVQTALSGVCKMHRVIGPVYSARADIVWGDVARARHPLVSAKCARCSQDFI